MSSVRIAAGTLALAAMLFAWGLSHDSRFVARPHVTSEWTTTTIYGRRGGLQAPVDGTLPNRLVDRYGNEIQRAVGDYRIDFRGDVYERHSPHTAIPKLPPPGT